MADLVRTRDTSPGLPAIVAAGGENVRQRFLEFFASNIRNRHTRRALSSPFSTPCQATASGSHRTNLSLLLPLAGPILSVRAC
jgi:hypothetical protein